MKKVYEILRQRGLLTPRTIGVLIKGQIVDLHSLADENSDLRPIIASDDSPHALEILRHSTCHIMADAVQRLFPGTKVAIGPSIEDGFYYDFDRPEGSFSADELGLIEGEMRKILSEEKKFERREITRWEAEEFFRQKGESYKLEILSEIPEDESVTVYSHGEWTDLCRGPHLPSTKFIENFKILKTAGAYWKGDERNKMLSRIYGIAFFKKQSLEDYLRRLELAKHRDHRRVGVQLELYSVDDSVGGGLILWHPRGGFIRDKIETFWKRAHLQAGYDIVFSPHIGRVELWKRSGHLDFYGQFMYPPVELEGAQYMLKPMNCPFHIAIFNSRVRSYRQLPLRWAELGTVYRFEKSGQLHGLLRVRGFTQDDAHIFCRQDQMGVEIKGVVRLSLVLLRSFGFEDFHIRLATRPVEGFIGDVSLWNKAEEHLRSALDEIDCDYEVDEGGGAFYGPKIDIDVRDVLGRLWQCTTVQLDFNLPERFDLKFTDSDGSLRRPIMIHRALLGSMERFFGVLIEHYGGAFPGWLSPEQIMVMNVTEKEEGYARAVAEKMKDEGIRACLDLSSSKLGAKIRQAQLMKVPFMGIVGKVEAGSSTISIRDRKEGEIGTMNIQQAIAYVKERCFEPELDLSNLYRD